LSCANKGWIEATLEANLERNCRPAGGLDGAIGVSKIVGDGLFAKHGLAGLRRGHNRLGVVAGGRGNDDRLDRWVGQQLLVVERPTLAAEGGGVALGEAGRGVSQADQASAWNAMGESLGVMGAHQADADHADANGAIHKGGRLGRHAGGDRTQPADGTSIP
jgi:hypothetical protein